MFAIANVIFCLVVNITFKGKILTSRMGLNDSQIREGIYTFKTFKIKIFYLKRGLVYTQP